MTPFTHVLTRLREDATKALRQARQQLNAFLLRHGRRYTDGSQKWTQAFARWLDGLRFDHSVQQVVFDEYVQAEASAASRVPATSHSRKKTSCIATPNHRSTHAGPDRSIHVRG